LKCATISSVLSRQVPRRAQASCLVSSDRDSRTAVIRTTKRVCARRRIGAGNGCRTTGETPAPQTGTSRPRSAGLPDSGERLPVVSPIEGWARVGLAPWGNVGVPYDVDEGVSSAQHHSQLREAPVLPFSKGLVVCAFEFHSQREIVAVFVPTPAGQASVPSALCARGELEHLPMATDQEVCRNP